jgi:hypothetical protein
MLLLRFYHCSNELFVDNKSYIATCDVRNEINGRRKHNQIVNTYPITSSLGRKPYMPRKFPTGLWKVKYPVWTSETDYAPVKIPTDALRRVLLWDVESGMYTIPNGQHQDDAFYHLHFARDSKTTLGCIRINSEEDAREIAKLVTWYMDKDQEVWLEVLVNED